jgi:hypothetical protein
VKARIMFENMENDDENEDEKYFVQIAILFSYVF